MSDIKSEKWLWVKGGLLIVLGLLACVILLLRNPEVSTLILLVLAIWSFSRAYYFAFYVIEHYADPSFRFAGLFSLWDYLIDRTEHSTSVRKRYSRDEASLEVYRIKSTCLQAMAVCMLAMFLVPSSIEWGGRTLWSMYPLVYPYMFGCIFFVIGALTTPYVALGILNGLASWPWLYRIPVSAAMTSMLTVCLFLGLLRIEANDSLRALVLLLPLTLYIVSSLATLFCRHAFGWRLVALSSMEQDSGSRVEQSRFGIGYLFFLCFLVAVVVALIRATIPMASLTYAVQLLDRQLLFFILYLVGSQALNVALVYSVLLNRATRRHRWIVCFVIAGNLLAPVLTVMVTGWILNVGAARSGFTEVLYAIQLGVTTSLGIFLVMLRCTNVRLCMSYQPRVDGTLRNVRL